MVARIPSEWNEELLKRAQSGATTRQLADWLVEDKKLPACSHVTVSRRLYAIRAAQSGPATVSAEEIERELQANAVLIQSADESLAELEEVALYGDPERDVKPDLAAAQRIAFKRANLALAMQRFLFARLRTARESAAQRLKARTDRLRQRELESEAEFFDDIQEGARRLTTRPKQKLASTPVSVAPSPGRNAPCPCGSGMKFKKCCGGPNVGVSETTTETGGRGVAGTAVNRPQSVAGLP